MSDCQCSEMQLALPRQEQWPLLDLESLTFWAFGPWSAWKRAMPSYIADTLAWQRQEPLAPLIHHICTEMSV